MTPPSLTPQEWFTLMSALSTAHGVESRMCVEQAGDPAVVKFFGERALRSVNLRLKLQPYVDSLGDAP